MMNKTIEYLKSGSNNVGLFIVAISAIIVATIIGRTTIWNAAAFLAVQVLFIYMPGYAIMYRIPLPLTSMERDFLSYAVGYSLSIVIYLISLILGIHNVIFYIYLPISLGAMSYLLISIKRNKSVICYYTRYEKKWFSIILGLSLSIAMVLYECANLSPMLFADGVNITNYQDLMFWMRNGVAATHSFPLPDLSYLGSLFNYHYFSSVEIAFLHLTTGISNYDLCFVYSYLISIFLLTSGLYVLAKAYKISEKWSFVFISFVLFTCSLEKVTDINFISHIYVTSFGLAEGLAFFCFSFALFKQIEESNNRNIMPRALLSFVFMVFVGVKAPLALIFLFGVGFKGLYRLFVDRRNRWDGIVMSFVLSALFVLVLAVFVTGAMKTQEVQPVSNMDMYPSFTSTMLHPHIFSKFYNTLISTGIPHILLYPIVLCVYLIMALLIPILLFCYAYRNNSDNGYKKVLFSSNLELIAMISVGVLLCIFISHKGMSQSYFMFPAIILLFLLAVKLLSITDGEKINKKYVITIFLSGALLFGGQFGTNMVADLYKLAKTTILKNTERGQRTSEEDGRSINKEELAGLQWVKDNTPQSAIVLSNKIFAKSSNDTCDFESLIEVPINSENYESLTEKYHYVYSARSYAVSCFSERQTFMEGYGYSNIDIRDIQSRAKIIFEFYSRNTESKTELERQGVSHAIIFKNIQPNEYPEQCKVIFENKEIKIVEL